MNELLSPKKVAEIFGVSPLTVRLWEKAGKITAIKTLGGHRRYSLKEIKEIVDRNKRK